MQRAMSQKAFLDHAMTVLGMSPEEFAIRLGAGSRTLERWRLPVEAREFLPMPDPLWRYIGELMHAARRPPRPVKRPERIRVPA